MWRDSFVNFVTKLGIGANEKAGGNDYQLDTMTQQQIDAAYRTSWLCRKVIDIPPLDMTREWRNWHADDDQISALEDEEKRLHLSVKVRRALTLARLYGGSAIVLGMNDDTSDQPLDIERVKKGDLKFIQVVNRFKLSAQEMDRDPMSDNFGNPAMFQISGSQSGSQRIHPSRLIRFYGNEIPDPDLSFDGWGDSYWMSLRDIVTDTDLVTTVVASLIQEAKVDIIRVPDFMSLVGTAANEANLLKRFMLANSLKSITNTLVLDGGSDGKGGEEWDRKTIDFTGLPDILDTYTAVAAGAADIPATRLLGRSPKGLNATGESDLRNYYDMLKSKQKLEMWPTLEPLDKIIQFNIFGKVDDNIYFESGPLWQQTPSERATIAAQKASTTKIYVDTGLINDEAMGKAVQNQLIEDGVYPGLVEALDEFGTEPNPPAAPPVLLPPGQNPPLPGQTPPKLLPAPTVPVKAGDEAPTSRTLDPTHTTNIRNAWRTTLNVRMKKAESRIRGLVRGSEAIGLEASHYRTLLGRHLGGDFHSKYIARAYRQGRSDAHARIEKPTAPLSEADLKTVRSKIDSARSDTDRIMEDLSNSLHNSVRSSASVSEAIKSVSENMKAVGRRLSAVVSVHTVGSHATAALATYRENGIQYVGADVERVPKAAHDHNSLDEELLQFATAGDNLVCPECEDLEGGIYTLDEAEGVIPVHPECRCAWIPVRSETGQFNPRISASEDSAMADASPRSLYVCRMVTNADAIIKWAKAQGFTTTLAASDMHVTIVYSKEPVDWMKMGSPYSDDAKGNMTVKPGGARIVDRLGPLGAIVLLFNSSELSWRHQDMIYNGASEDYDEYQPHITITYDPPPDLVISEIEPYRGPIELGPEIFEEITNEHTTPEET
jgi:uncharacterized protein